MSYKIVLTDIAKEKLDGIKQKDKETGKRIKKKLKGLSDYPEKKGKRLKHSNRYLSIRIGKYRAIYRVKEDSVKIVWIGHREKVYEEFRKTFL